MSGRFIAGLTAALMAVSPAHAQQIQIFSTQAPGGDPGVPVPMPPRDGSVKTGTAIIRGRVFAADTGQPLRKAQVRATSPELRENRLTTTDADGRYELRDLPAGRYNVSAGKGSYLTLQYGQTRPLEPGKPIDILDKQATEKVDFSLPRGGVITGRIVDEFGEPVSDVQVGTMRYQFVQGRRQLVPAGRFATTNDIGEFRLFALPPGQYYLSARFGQMFGPLGESDDRNGYAPTYYPGTSNIAEAQRLTVEIGQMLTDVTVMLVSTRTARISGTAVDSTGKPFVGAMVSIGQREGSINRFMTGNQIRPDGSFSVSGIAPGEYSLQVMMPGTFGEAAEFATTNVSVNGSDVDDVRLVGTKPSTITGRLVVDPAAASSLRPTNLRLMLAPATPDMPMFGPAGGGTVKDDLTFELKARPGRWRLFVPAAPAGWAIKAVRSAGTDVTDLGIDVRPNEDTSDIEVEFTNRLTNVSGLVINAPGDQAKDYTVVLFAQDHDQWNAGSRYIRTGRPDQDGRFKIAGLPAGRYYAVALDHIEQGEETDTEFLDRNAPRATTFSLGDGETKTVDLRLTTN